MRNVTHAEHRIIVAPGANVVIDIDFTSWGDTLSGLQIVPLPAPLGAHYCGSNTNSSGAAATILALGSTDIAAGDFTLVAQSLAPNQFGFFLTSMTQGFVPNAGGSQGNLCLGGVIGRYVGPGFIQSSGVMGMFSLAVDLQQTPAGGTFVAVVPGETWNFQAWYRDLGPMGQPGSNFTDACSVTF